MSLARACVFQCLREEAGTFSRANVFYLRLLLSTGTNSTKGMKDFLQFFVAIVSQEQTKASLISR